MSSRTLAKKLASVKPGTLFAGVDLALGRNVVVVMNERAERLDRFEFPNTRRGYDYLYRRLESHIEKHQAPAAMVGMEPTNYIWKLLAADMEKNRPKDSYRLVNSYTVKKDREGRQLDRAKSDDRDAFTIGDMLRTGKFTETRLLHGGYAELRQYAKTHKRLRRDMGQHKSTMHNLVGQLFPEFSSEFKDITGLTALAALRYCASAVLISQMPVEEFIAGVRSQFKGSRLMVTKLWRLHKLAQRSVGLTEGIQALQLALRCHIDVLEALKAHVAEVDEGMIATFEAMSEAEYMMSVPGLGIRSAAIILGEIGNPDNYTNGGQWIKLAGTQPVPNTSGRRSKSKTPISHKGRALLRTTLYFAVLHVIPEDEAFARQYAELQTREKNPLTKKQALVVLMNKLLRILWSLIKNRTYYDPNYQAAG